MLDVTKCQWRTVLLPLLLSSLSMANRWQARPWVWASVPQLLWLILPHLRALPLPKPLPISQGRISPSYQTLPCRRTGWQPVVRTKKTKPCLMRCMPWAKRFVRHLVLPFLWVKTACQCGRIGQMSKQTSLWCHPCRSLSLPLPLCKMSPKP